MHFYKKTSIGKSNDYIKLLIKVVLLFYFFVILIMLDQINFPAPNKKIEKLIPNETFKDYQIKVTHFTFICLNFKCFICK